MVDLSAETGVCETGDSDGDGYRRTGEEGAGDNGIGEPWTGDGGYDM